MEAHEHEPSYYEVALTNRQVVTGFVLLLLCLFVAFLSGVWLGQESGGGTAVAAPAGAAPLEAGEAKLEQLTFFGGSATPAPERAAPTPAEIEAEKLRKTLEAEMAQHRTDLAAADAPVAAAPAPAGTRVRREATAAATATAAAAPVAAAPARVEVPPATGAVWIQVYSSTNGDKAQELATQLRRSSFKVAVLTAAGAGGTAHRVRVGPYATRGDADRAAARLRREQRLDTWVTDQP